MDTAAPNSRIVPITSLNGPWPLHDSAATRSGEARLLARSAPGAAMEGAGLAAARLALSLAGSGGPVQVFCGPGNNGGDGLVAARLLHQQGLAVQVSLCADAAHLPADAAQALLRAREAGVAIRPFSAAAHAGGTHSALVVDALLGLGSRRPPTGELAEAIAVINAAHDGPVLALDLPSGLHPDTGALFGAEAARAQHTLSLLSLKPGLFTAQGRDHAGQVWLADLGASGDLPAPIAQLSTAAAVTAWPHATHKGSRGDVLVVGGAHGMAGAAWLACAAALSAAAGRVYLAPLSEDQPAIDPNRPECMWRPRAWEDSRWLAGVTVVAGCGGGAAIEAVLPALLAHAPRLVLDADGLNAVARSVPLQTLLEGRRARAQSTVLTPHPLEAARLLGLSALQVQADRLRHAGALAQRLQATVVLKGSGSVIATPEGGLSINPSGNAALATPGSGDVLAGWTGGLWAQRPTEDGATVAAESAWWHGRAADLHGDATPLLAGALVAAIGAARQTAARAKQPTSLRR